MTLKETLHLGHHRKDSKDITADNNPTNGTNGNRTSGDIARVDTMASTSSTEAIPKGAVTETASTLEERLRAWKHVVGKLEMYIEQHELLYRAVAKEYEKVGKVSSLKRILFPIHQCMRRQI